MTYLYYSCILITLRNLIVSCQGFDGQGTTSAWPRSRAHSSGSFPTPQRLNDTSPAPGDLGPSIRSLTLDTKFHQNSKNFLRFPRICMNLLIILNRRNLLFSWGIQVWLDIQSVSVHATLEDWGCKCGGTVSGKTTWNECNYSFWTCYWRSCEADHALEGKHLAAVFHFRMPRSCLLRLVRSLGSFHSTLIPLWHYSHLFALFFCLCLPLYEIFQWSSLSSAKLWGQHAFEVSVLRVMPVFHFLLLGAGAPNKSKLVRTEQCSAGAATGRFLMQLVNSQD